MCGRSKKVSRIAAFIVVTINLISMILCLVFFALSLWTIASPDSFVLTIRLIGNQTFNELISEYVSSLQAIITGAFVSGFILFISAMGLYGVLSGSQFLLFMYATLVILLMLLEAALFYYFSSNITEKGLQEEDGIFNHGLRVAFHCCDKNYTSSVASPPWSCCDSSTNCTAAVIYKTDCKQEVSSWLNDNQTTVYIVLTVVHILLSSCSLVRRSYSASHSHT